MVVEIAVDREQAIVIFDRRTVGRRLLRDFDGCFAGRFDRSVSTVTDSG